MAVSSSLEVLCVVGEVRLWRAGAVQSPELILEAPQECPSRRGKGSWESACPVESVQPLFILCKMR